MCLPRAFVVPHIAAVNCSYLVEGAQDYTQNYQIRNKMVCMYGVKVYYYVLLAYMHIAHVLCSMLSMAQNLSCIIIEIRSDKN